MTEETNKAVAAVAAPESKSKRMAREPIYATGFSFTDANMARATTSSLESIEAL